MAIPKFLRHDAQSGAPAPRQGPCPFCGARVEGGAPACLELLAGLAERARQEKPYAEAHRFSVDAHALQHPELHGRLSNHVHLLSLCLMLERGAGAGIGSRQPAIEDFLALGRQWPPIEAPAPGRRGTLTVQNVFQAPAADRPLLARRWAEEIWGIWQPHHPWARRTLDRLSHD